MRGRDPQRRAEAAVQAGVGEAHMTCEAGQRRPREGASLQGASQETEAEEIGLGPANSRPDPEVPAEALRQGQARACFEPPRDSQRLQNLRGWRHDTAMRARIGSARRSVAPWPSSEGSSVLVGGGAARASSGRLLHPAARRSESQSFLESILARSLAKHEPVFLCHHKFPFI